MRTTKTIKKLERSYRNGSSYQSLMGQAEFYKMEGDIPATLKKIHAQYKQQRRAWWANNPGSFFLTILLVEIINVALYFNGITFGYQVPSMILLAFAWIPLFSAPFAPLLSTRRNLTSYENPHPGSYRKNRPLGGKGSFGGRILRALPGSRSI